MSSVYLLDLVWHADRNDKLKNSNDYRKRKKEEIYFSKDKLARYIFEHKASLLKCDD